MSLESYRKSLAKKPTYTYDEQEPKPRKEKSKPKLEVSGDTCVVYVQTTPKRSNGAGVAGFVMSLCAFFFAIISPIFIVSFFLLPFGVVGMILGAFLTFLGFIFSLLGLFRTPRGLAIAGFVISLLIIVGFIIMLSGTGAVVTALHEAAVL